MIQKLEKASSYLSQIGQWFIKIKQIIFEELLVDPFRNLQASPPCIVLILKYCHACIMAIILSSG